MELEAPQSVAGGNRDAASSPKERQAETVTVEAARRKPPDSWRAEAVTVEPIRNMTAINWHAGNCPYVADCSLDAGSSPKRGGRTP